MKSGRISDPHEADGMIKDLRLELSPSGDTF